GPKEFVVVDAAMNDLIRPALYRAHHDIVPVRKNALPGVTADVVGPICETGDFLARDREMANVMPGDFVAVCAAGAYGFVQAPNWRKRRLTWASTASISPSARAGTSSRSA